MQEKENEQLLISSGQSSNRVTPPNFLEGRAICKYKDSFYLGVLSHILKLLIAVYEEKVKLKLILLSSSSSAPVHLYF